ncbi:MAG: preprotein translocase subunit SecG, partial [Leptolyngbya sp. PLA1]|nr:preprotein translocase subunit SecG [Leptolyngbya sp. PLA1]
MTTLAFVWPDWLVGLTTVLFLAVCVIMVLTVLIQKPQGGGLASAFGGSGAGSGQTAFGAKTGDALTVFTIIVFVVYLAFAVVLNFAMRPAPPICQRKGQAYQRPRRRSGRDGRGAACGGLGDVSDMAGSGAGRAKAMRAQATDHRPARGRDHNYGIELPRKRAPPRTG